jgi:hypothetical protein
MHFPLIFCLAAWTSKCTAKATKKQGIPSLYLVGDSTMAFHPVSQGIPGCVLGEIFFRHGPDVRISGGELKFHNSFKTSTY